MEQPIRETDWRLLRKLHPVALDRFSRRILDEIAVIMGDSRHTAHERYLSVYRRIERRTREMQQAFDECGVREPSSACFISAGSACLLKTSSRASAK